MVGRWGQKTEIRGDVLYGWPLSKITSKRKHCEKSFTLIYKAGFENVIRRGLKSGISLILGLLGMYFDAAVV